MTVPMDMKVKWFTHCTLTCLCALNLGSCLVLHLPFPTVGAYTVKAPLHQACLPDIPHASRGEQAEIWTRGTRLTSEHAIHSAIPAGWLGLYFCMASGFPHGLENLENGKMGILNRLEAAGNFIQNTGKEREF